MGTKTARKVSKPSVPVSYAIPVTRHSPHNPITEIPMTEENTNDTPVDETQAATDETQADTSTDAGTEKKAKAKSNKPRKARKPKLKDWIRVQKSTGNGCENKEVILRINEATGIVELITNAPKAEGSDEAEGQRVQVFQITGFQVINEPDADPLGLNDEAAEDAEAPAEGEPANA